VPTDRHPSHPECVEKFLKVLNISGTLADQHFFNLYSGFTGFTGFSGSVSSIRFFDAPIEVGRLLTTRHRLLDTLDGLQERGLIHADIKLSVPCKCSAWS
jgi:hypothetical protein